MDPGFYLSALVQGLAFGGLGLGIYLSLRIFNIPDITTDGSYTLGGVVTAIGMTAGWPPLAASVMACAAGALAGICSGMIHTRLRVDALLSGILVMTALYSINLMLMGRPNLPVANDVSVLNMIGADDSQTAAMLSAVVLIGSVLVALLFFLRSDFGIALRATGNSPSMARASGIAVNSMKVAGLGISNALVAFSGSMLTQYQGFADINMGIGIVIGGLGAVMVGEALPIPLLRKGIAGVLLAVVLGSILFRFAIATALCLGIDPNYLRLMTALIVLGIITLGRIRKKQHA
ncbi:MAG: ABC transporter permease [Bacteroidota bacterium]|jgi:putative ABC transport system permease protein